jgi:hypothetical protein
MTKPKTVGKDFSVLKKEERIELTAFAVYQLVFKGEKERAFQPKPKTIVYSVWNSGKLSLRQQRAWMKFLDDVEKAEGHSGNVTSSYGDFTDGGSGDHFRVPRARENDELKMVDYICNRFLSKREYQLLCDLFRDHLQNRGQAKVEDIGLIRSGYNGKRDAYVAGAVNIQNLLDRLADAYHF